MKVKEKMNVIRKYWDSVYIYILLILPALCMCAGAFWTVFKLMGHYENLSWHQIIIFDCSQIIYLTISLFFIFMNKKTPGVIYKNLVYVKVYILVALLVQYNFILYLFASVHVWSCTFIFFAFIVFCFDAKLTIINLSSYIISLVIAHIWRPEVFLPWGDEGLVEIIAFRITTIVLTAFCIVVIAYFAEHFLVQAKEQNEENVHLMEKQLAYYKDMELLDTELRKFRHDINNHFICMESLLKNGKLEELKEYFQDLKQSNSGQRNMYCSGNDVVDAILHYEMPRSLNENVEVNIHGALSDIRTVSSMDLCTVFSNLLSNAIASANQCLENGNAQIGIRFSCGKHFFSISISNSIASGSEGKLRDKRDRNHGFGLNNIQEVLEKYDGKLEKSVEDNTISITIYLPI